LGRYYVYRRPHPREFISTIDKFCNIIPKVVENFDRVLEKGINLKITSVYDSNGNGLFTHLKVDHQGINSIACFSNSYFLTIGEFKSLTKEYFNIKLAPPVKM
jgi:hypothetical protein